MSTTNDPPLIATAYGVGNSVPISAFIGRDGRLHRRYPGEIDGSTIATELHQLGVR